MPPGTLPNADVNSLLFLSDGEPNRALEDDGDIITVSAQNAIDHILGVDDSSNEVGNTETDGDGAGLDQAFTIEAFGVNANVGGLTILNQVEGAGGSAQNITAPGDLSTYLNTLLASLAGAPGNEGDCTPIVVHDETTGVQTTADPNESTDVAGGSIAPAAVLTLFNAITDKGVDADGHRSTMAPSASPPAA